MNTKALALLALLSLGTAAPVLAYAAPTPATQVEEAKKHEHYDHLNIDKQGLAIEGYDPVAYFEEGGAKPTKGKKELHHEVGGVTYRFASKAHLELFKKDPAKYEPAYGGWCAYAMADGDKVEVDPKSYLIQDGKLMLFYKSFFHNTRKSWMKKPKDYQAKADKAWAKITTPPKPKPQPKAG